MSSKLTLLLLVSGSAGLASAISCFECDSSNDFSCTEFWDPDAAVIKEYYSDCSHVYDAKYCVKMTGVFDGKLGTKRFCSSKDWGYYCEYIERPGDIQEYRSCVYSCSTNACNAATGVVKSLSFSTNALILFLSTLVCIFAKNSK